MSTKRSSTGVQTLRAMFENGADSPSQASAGRQSNGDRLSMTEGQQPLAKVRSSFIAVDADKDKSIATDDSLKHTQDEPQTTGNAQTEDSRDSAQPTSTPTKTDRSTLSKPNMAVDLVTNGTPVSANTTNGGEQTSADVAAKRGETETPTANNSLEPGDIETPSSYAPELVTLPDHDVPAQNPDKPVTGAETEPGVMQEGDPKTDAATTPARDRKSLSSEKAETPKRDTTPLSATKQTEAQKSRISIGSVKAAATSQEPSSPKAQPKSRLSVGAPKTATPKQSLPSPTAAKISSVLKAPSQPKSSTTGTKSTVSNARIATDPTPTAVPSSTPSRKTGSAAPRQSLTAPTEASSARRRVSSDIEKKSTERKSSATSSSKAGARPGKDFLAHLMAPTESSRAKEYHEKEQAVAAAEAPKSKKPTSFRASTTSASKPAKLNENSQSKTAGLGRTKSLAARNGTGPRTSSATTRLNSSKESTSRVGSTSSGSGSFLERMMRPTEASKAHQHEPVPSDSTVKRSGSVLKKKVAQAQHKVARKLGLDKDEPAEASSGAVADAGSSSASTGLPANDSDIGTKETTPATPAAPTMDSTAGAGTSTATTGNPAATSDVASKDTTPVAREQAQL